MGTAPAWIGRSRLEPHATGSPLIQMRALNGAVETLGEDDVRIVGIDRVVGRLATRCALPALRADAIAAAGQIDDPPTAPVILDRSVNAERIGHVDRDERIAANVVRQGRVTDHRIKLTLYNLPEVMEGDLGTVVQPLINEYQADQLASLAAED